MYNFNEMFTVNKKEYISKMLQMLVKIANHLSSFKNFLYLSIARISSSFQLSFCIISLIVFTYVQTENSHINNFSKPVYFSIIYHLIIDVSLVNVL